MTVLQHGGSPGAGRDDYLYETVWDDTSISAGAGGGGVSQLFGEPFYQYFTLPPKTQKQLGGHRGVPHVSYNADDPSMPLTKSFVDLGGERIQQRPAGQIGPFLLQLLGVAHRELGLGIIRSEPRILRPPTLSVCGF